MSERQYTIAPGASLDVNPGFTVRSLTVDNPTPALVTVDLGQGERNVSAFRVGVILVVTLLTMRVHVTSALAAGAVPGPQQITVTASDQAQPDSPGAPIGANLASGPQMISQQAFNVGPALATNPGTVLPEGDYWLHSVQMALFTSNVGPYAGYFQAYTVLGLSYVVQNARTDGEGLFVSFAKPVPFHSDGVHGLAAEWIAENAIPADGSVEMFVIFIVEQQ